MLHDFNESRSLTENNFGGLANGENIEFVSQNGSLQLKTGNNSGIWYMDFLTAGVCVDVSNVYQYLIFEITAPADTKFQIELVPQKEDCLVSQYNFVMH